MSTNTFEGLALAKPILRALREEGYDTPTPIQSAAIPHVLAGEDLLATAQTGTGKTAGFALPMLHLLQGRKARQAKRIRALILTPTRELALQIEESLKAYGRHLPLRTATILGGVAQGPQIKALQRGTDILVATPGRLLDLMSQGHVHLEAVEMLVLDEADRMLDMGFIRDVRRIVSQVPRERQTLLFSATLSSEIAEFASDMLVRPSLVEVTPPASVSGSIEQKVLFVQQSDKRNLLEEILSDKHMDRVLIFTRTKHRANRISQQLAGCGIPADAIHSNKSQSARQKALAAFDRGTVRVLVGTDIVARGIDVDGISHVINYELPNDAESYVHRIGRTARAGASGVALSFCGADEVPILRGIERLTRCALTEVEDHPYRSSEIAAMWAPPVSSRGGGRQGRSQRQPQSARSDGDVGPEQSKG